MASKQTISIILISIATFFTGYLVSLAMISTSMNSMGDSYIWSDKKNITGIVVDKSDKELTISLYDGEKKHIHISPKTQIYLLGSTEIQTGMRIKVYHKDDDGQKDEITAIFIKNLDFIEPKNNHAKSSNGSDPFKPAIVEPPPGLNETGIKSDAPQQDNKDKKEIF